MKLHKIYLSKRTIVKNLITILFFLRPNYALAYDIVNESDPDAKLLGYKNNAALVKKDIWTKYEMGQSCNNCSLFQPLSSSQDGYCILFRSRKVMASGWCNSWARRS